MADCATRAHPHNSPLRSECSTSFRPFGCAFVMGREERHGREGKQAACFCRHFSLRELLNGKIRFRFLRVNNVSVSSVFSKRRQAIAVHALVVCFRYRPIRSLTGGEDERSETELPVRLRLEAHFSRQDAHCQSPMRSLKRLRGNVS